MSIGGEQVHYRGNDSLNDWLLLVYKIPREPSAPRVQIWRKLKQLGALLLQDAVWVLPSKSRTQEQFQWLAAEINELGGEAAVWQSRLLPPAEGQTLADRFQEQAATVHQEILESLATKSPDLAALSRRFQQAQAIDYFPSDLSRETREALLAATTRNDA